MMLDEDDGFTFAAVSPLSVADDGGGGVFVSGGRMVGALYYPVFGRPRSPPRPPSEPETATATARIPLAELLLADREPSSAPVPQPPAPDDELDSVPAELYCPWSPGWSATASPAPRCRKSRSTGSSILRWRPRLVGRSQSDGKEKFVFFSTSSSASASRRNNNNNKGRNGTGEGGGSRGHAWSYYAKGSATRRTTFLPYKQDLVGLFANAAMFRRSYHPF